MGRLRGREFGEIQFLTNSGKKKLDEALKELSAQKKIIRYDKENGIYIHEEYFQKAKQEIISVLKKYHSDFPLKSGLLKEELRSRTAGSRNQKLFNYLITQLANDNVIVQEKELIRLTEHRVTLARNEEKIRNQIEEAYRKGGLQPPYFKEIKDQFPGKAGQDVLEVMIKDGVLIKVKEDLFFHRDSMTDLQNRLVRFLKENGEINTPQFKEMTGASRKYTIPILEYFDRSQITVRVGDNRVLRKK